MADGRSPRDGRFIELVGTYDPRNDPPKVALKADRVKHWMSVGAKPSPTVSQLMRKIEVQAKEAS